MYMYRFAMVVGHIYCFLFCDLYARAVFIACAYRRRHGHGKSWNRAYKHYKKNWSFFQRMFWVFVFKEYYEPDYRFMAYLSYIHAAITIFTSACFLICDIFFPESWFWRYEYVVFGVYSFLRLIYDNSIARGIIKP